MNLLIGFLPQFVDQPIVSSGWGIITFYTFIFAEQVGELSAGNVVWYILILCSFSDAAAGSLRVWLFIYQDQGWTSPDLVCLGATLLLTLLHLILLRRYITINIALHYFPGRYITTFNTARALHYITYITTLLVCPSTTLLTAAWR